MNEPIYWTFTFTCQTCGETVQVTDGVQEAHGCPPNPAVTVSGCDPWVEFDRGEGEVPLISEDGVTLIPISAETLARLRELVEGTGTFRIPAAPEDLEERL